MTSTAARRKEAVLNVRLTRQTRDLIDSAAEVVGKSRSEFIIESARKSAMDALLDQRFFMLEPEDFAKFIAILESPPPPNRKLKALFARKAPWET